VDGGSIERDEIDEDGAGVNESAEVRDKGAGVTNGELELEDDRKEETGDTERDEHEDGDNKS
jgi:hypothetical protein